MLDDISVRQAAEKREISERRIQKLCEENRVAETVRFGHAWAIPKDARKPADKRKTGRTEFEL
ncbi:DNA-binding protein [Caproicibacter fermentans]|uniref:DNA-binding protein n=1 Tax=Caproicibacter fermentans TaxID=2576756 RepID=A0A7G8T850_9FIRM|nr:DNA-binding protein [Caproicibacter fermentans]QNK39791.1 DNA-binding protein [Caproicibacter fermentans]